MWNRRCEGGEPLVLLGETRRTRCSNKSRERLQIVYNQPNSLFSRTSSLSDHWQAQSPLMRESRSLIKSQYAVKFSPAKGGPKPPNRALKPAAPSFLLLHCGAK